MISCVVVSVLLFTNAVWCLADGPGVCKNQEMVKTEGKKQLVNTFCCEGYKKENGVCVDCPNCTSKVCPENYCGDTCIEMCDCPKHAYCDNLYCCICSPGLRGVFCNETCIHGYYGPGCKNKCTCQTQEKCDPVTGNCTSNTSTICSPDTASNNSLDSCVGSNNSNSLLHDDMSETSECDIGYYGQGCKNKCICQSDQQCDQVTGNCSSNVNQPGTTSQKTEGFKFINIAVILLAVVIIISACISLVIHFSRNRRVNYKTTDPIGHYGEMHPNDEIGPEEFQTLQEPLYSMPSHANSLMHPLHSIERNGRRMTTNRTDASASFNSKRGCKIYKCMSLPNLSSKCISLEQDNEMKSLNTRSCNQLTQQTLYLTDSDYLNPYCSLLKSAVSGSDYLNPYTTLLTTTDEGNIYEN